MPSLGVFDHSIDRLLIFRISFYFQNVFGHNEEPVNAPITSGIYRPGAEHRQNDIVFV